MAEEEIVGFGPVDSDALGYQHTWRERGMGQKVMLKHFSLDHRFIVLDNENRWIEDCYRDDGGNLHIRVSEETYER